MWRARTRSVCATFLDFGVIDGLDLFFLDLGAYDLGQIAVTQRLGLIGREPALVIFSIGDAFLMANWASRWRSTRNSTTKG